jgi:hypothetical protein
MVRSTANICAFGWTARQRLLFALPIIGKISDITSPLSTYRTGSERLVRGLNE